MMEFVNPEGLRLDGRRPNEVRKGSPSISSLLFRLSDLLSDLQAFVVATITCGDRSD